MFPKTKPRISRINTNLFLNSCISRSFAAKIPHLRSSAQNLRQNAQPFPKQPISCTLIGMKTLLRLCICLTALAASAQHLVDQKTFDAIATEYSGEGAQENTRRIVEYHRIQGSPMMTAVAHEVVDAQLKIYGIVAFLEQFPSDGKTKYGTYISPMGWDMHSGELWVESVGDAKDFKPILLCRYSEVPMCVSTYSKSGDWRGELVDVGSGTSDANYQGIDLRGKVALASGYAANVVRQAVLKHGAVGVVIYPDAADRPDHPDLVRYNGIWPRAEELDKTSGGFQISRNQYERLKSLMQHGPVRVHGRILAPLGPGKLTLVHAYIRGTENPEREVLITGHLDHPKWSANDNASGSGAMMEAARTLQALITAKKLAPPKLTIHFMWVPEYFGTLAYISNHSEARRCDSPWDDPRKQPTYAVHPGKSCVVANINMDMVGEDTVKTNSRFYFTKSPDSVPSFLDGLLSDVLEQTREADLYAMTGTRNYWLPEAIAYTQGSDHDVFLGLGVPSTMLGHDPDWTHHSSEDKIDKTDASEFRRVGVFASAAAYFLSTASGADTEKLNAMEHASRASELAHRLAADAGSNPAAHRIIENQKQFETASKGLISVLQPPPHKYTKWLDEDVRGSIPVGPHRLAILPLDASAFEGVSAEDGKWLAEQEARFSSDSEGLATKANFGLISFEAVNFMDGHRSTAEIANLLSAEYLLDIDQAWVDRLVSILEKQKLVAK
jgi:aminopeptidase YwaD